MGHVVVALARSFVNDVSTIFQNIEKGLARA